MRNFKASIVAVFVVMCFAFGSFAVQPAEARSAYGKAGISAPVKHKKAVKKAKKAKKVKKAKKAKKVKKAKRF